ncbi:MAG: RnfABCDGE type electron transport complex subunit G [Oscillospiraceae bacterium]|nr:RnfABCDGE type electron transport complex subunit G [Oscillospiraceae bacterium]MDD5921213.1 RnfABCDGE type electron transport complex subunit G [Oscillospiraceae bacterium]
MKFVKDFLIPVVVLTVICAVVSAALVFTYQATKPIIDEAKNAEANAARAVVLPGASGFEEVELSAQIEGAVDAYKETSGKGYVVTASAQGYGGPVNLMVGFDENGTITGVKMLEHQETPGFGAKLAEDSYGAGYVGKTASDYTEVDGISGASITSKAYKKALGTAFELYSAASGNSVEISEVVDEPTEDLVLYTVDDANAALVPGGVTKYEQEVDKVKEVYIANDKSAVTMVVTAQGYHEEPLIRLVVAMDSTGAITGVKPVDFAETEGVGDRVGKASYLDQYIGQTTADGVDALSGATVSSNAVKKAIGKAVDAFELVKGELAA